MNKKVLIISNEAFSDVSSNGRTMKNMLFCVPKENLAQFYIHGTPDVDFCAQYYGVSDSDALRAFLFCKRRPKSEGGHTGAGKSDKTPKRNYRNLVLRNAIWQSMRWWTREFDAFLDTFGPDVVLLQAGDAPFMYKIAKRIARKYGAKLMMFNTENYVLKKRMYAAKPGDSLFWHNILMKSLKRQYGSFMERADFCAYCTEYLEEIYQEKYPHPGKSAVFYTGTEMKDCAGLAEKGSEISLVYCGNLGVGRVQPLCTVAEILKKVASDGKLVIYGKFTSEEEKLRLCGYENVEYRGFVSYEEIPYILSKATLVLHCENPERLEDLKAAFSTKIADCLACGIPFLVFADRGYPFVQYLDKNMAAHIAEEEQELKMILESCKADQEYAARFVSNAKRLAANNHCAKRNSERLWEILQR